MADDILSMYGGDSGAPEKPRATNGGQLECKDVNNYKPPMGPKGMMHEGPGLGDMNCGNAVMQGKH